MAKDFSERQDSAFSKGNNIYILGSNFLGKTLEDPFCVIFLKSC